MKRTIEKLIDTNGKYVLNGGAGSGKTKLLIDNIEYSLKKDKRVLAITYTNVAVNEIKNRLKGIKSGVVQVSTIHSFLRGLLKEFRSEANALLPKLHPKREVKYESFEFSEDAKYESKSTVIRLNSNSTIKLSKLLFDNYSKVYDYINESYDLVVIDEYQDTNKAVIEIFTNETIKSGVGLYGDPMQAIYNDTGYSMDIPESFTVLNKEDNYRSNQNIVDFCNGLRTDGLVQTSRVDGEGKLYIIESDYLQEDIQTQVKELTGLKPDSIMYLTHDLRLKRLDRDFYEDYWKEIRKTGKSLSDLVNPKWGSHIPFVVELMKVRDGVSKDTPLALRELVGEGIDDISDLINIFQSLEDNEELLEELKDYVNEYMVKDFFKFIDVDANWDVYEDIYKVITSKDLSMTMHASKGREFDTVVVDLTNDGWDKYSFDVALGIKGTQKGYKRSVSVSLLYVAASRAKKNLVFIVPEDIEYEKSKLLMDNFVVVN